MAFVVRSLVYLKTMYVFSSTDKYILITNLMMSFSRLEAWIWGAEGAQIDVLSSFGGLVPEISRIEDFD